jgi:hypothetical protein
MCWNGVVVARDGIEPPMELASCTSKGDSKGKKGQNAQMFLQISCK